MSHMPNAPLIYTLALVRFPRVPEFEKFTDKFFAQIRAQYPYDEKFDQVTVSAELGASGLRVREYKKVIWQYLSENKDCGFLLGDDMLCFHTSNYKDSRRFLDRFKFGLTRFAAIPEIGVQLITTLGIRYVDLVDPPEGKLLSNFLEEWVLPKESPDEGIEILEGAYMAKYRTDMGTLNFQAIRNPEILIPPDLQSPFLEKNGWVKDKPKSKDFAVIDTDHFVHLSEPDNKFNPDRIIEDLDKLHMVPKKVFASLGTPDAKKFWSSEE